MAYFWWGGQRTERLVKHWTKRLNNPKKICPQDRERTCKKIEY